MSSAPRSLNGRALALTVIALTLGGCGSSTSSTEAPQGSAPSADSRGESFLDKTVLAEASPPPSGDPVDERFVDARAAADSPALEQEQRIDKQIAKENEAAGLGAFSCPLTATQITSAASEPMVKSGESSLDCTFVQEEVADSLGSSGVSPLKLKIAMLRAAGASIDDYTERSRGCAGMGSSRAEDAYDPESISFTCSTDSDLGRSETWDLVYPMPENKAVWSLGVISTDTASAEAVARIGNRIVQALDG